MMTINGLGQFDMMSAYNRIENISKVPVEAPKQEVKPVEQVPKQEEAPGLKINLNLDGIRSKSNASLDDISRDFTKRDKFSLTNYDAEAMQTEMDKAISEMNMDASLKQYQYFVGDSKVITNDEDGIVIMK
ncbi:MAG: hypothetical protein Q4E51_01300 [Lachnospiraceae bacterium]|nr:hypothetical protein [Lachnospiraceae bacterium]